MAFMGSLANARCLLLFAVCLSSVCDAKSGFLQRARQSLARRLDFGSLDQELGAVLTEALGLGHGLTPAQQEAKTAKILPMFETMPKNMYGRVNHDAMQYMAQRYFGYEHGWNIKGFDASSTVNATASGSLSAKVLKQKLPLYVESVIEHRLEREGFSLQDVVTLVVVLERMIFDEGMQMLEDAYYLKEMETSSVLTRNELMEVVFTYMLLYGFEADRRNRTDLSETMKQINAQYPEGWASGVYGMDEATIVVEEMRRENPFAGKKSGYSFDVAHQAVRRATEGYGKWSNEEECQELKGVLTELDREGTGRVRLVDFYARASSGNNWYFEETPEYLRAQGVLDETSASRGIQLIIPNYVQAPSNCIEASTFYSICCIKECDSLMGVIEREIRAPMASPARIFLVVQRLIDAKEEERRNLTTQLIAQLEAVAELHMGQVPLHGRLFSSWLHYVFPYECPFPQTRSEAVQSQIISEYSKRTGLPSVFTRSQRDKYVKENRADEEEEEEDLVVAEPNLRDMSQWTMEEELYVGYDHQGPRIGIRDPGAWSIRSMLRSLAQTGIIVGGVLSLRGTYRGLFGKLETTAGGCREVFV